MNPELSRILFTDANAAAVLAALTRDILEAAGGRLYLAPRTGMSLGMCREALRIAVRKTYMEIPKLTQNVLNFEAEAVYEVAWNRAVQCDHTVQTRRSYEQEEINRIYHHGDVER